MVKAQASKSPRKKVKGKRGRVVPTNKHHAGHGRGTGNKKTPSLEADDIENTDDSGDDSLDPEELQYFEDQGRNLSFLRGIFKSSERAGNLKAGSKRKIKGQENEEADFEKRPRSMLQDVSGRQTLLPLKSKQGLIHRKGEVGGQVAPQEHTELEEDVESKANPNEETNNEDNLTESVAVTSTVQLLATRQQKLMERKSRIASLASDIVENPEENIGMLKELCGLCEEKDVDIRITTKKLAMVSLLTIFKDIIPGYRIRPPTEVEKNMKVSKDVKKLREYEEGLLSCYQKYLQFLEQAVQDWVKHRDNNKKNKNLSVNGYTNHRQSIQRMAVVSVQCMCDLMTSVPHFNFCTNILTVLVPWMNDKSLGEETNKMCCNAFNALFTHDTGGEISLDAVKVIAKFVKAKGYAVQPCVLQTFLSLKISEMDVLSLRNKKEEQLESTKKGKNRREKMLKGKMSKRDRKRKKEMKKLEKELQETEAVQSQEKKARLQTEMLNQVFVTYFRILKHGQESPLLSTVLEGLARYALLINVDFFADLMSALQTLVTSQNLQHKDRLNCVLTAFKILCGQGEALNIDPRGFYTSLYVTLLQLHAGSTNVDVPIALKCLDAMIYKRRKQVPIQRVAAFMKRLLTQSVHTMANSSLALLSCTKSLLQAHPKVQSLLDSENLGTGVFRPEVDDPELCNANCTTVWELATLAGEHFHPAVKTLAVHVAHGAPSKGSGTVLTRKPSEEFYKAYANDQTLISSLPSDKPQSKAVRKQRVRTVDETSWKETLIGPAAQEAMDFAERHFSTVTFCLPINEISKDRKAGLTS